MTPIYLFGGLGADERVFQHIDFEGLEVYYIQWITPLKNETIASYAKRLTAQIKFEKPILIGVSFGGMMAVEVGKIIAVEKIILISSAKTKYEIPWYYRVAGVLKLPQLVPASLLKSPNAFVFWLFGLKNNRDKQLLTGILRDTDTGFLKWAIHKIATWQNLHQPTRFIHLHGTADRILPYRFIKNAIPVKGGGHFMIVDKAKINQSIINTLIPV